MNRLILYWILLLLLFSCNMEKDVEVPLPAFTSQPVVECYIEPGQPYRLSLLGSVSYFDQPEVPVIPNALVLITHRGITDTLHFHTNADTLHGKIYYYYGDTSKKVPAHYNEPFTLFIKDLGGNTLSASTVIIPPVTIDTIEFNFNDEGRATSNITFQDDPNTKDYYRYLVVVDPINYTEKGDVLFTDALFQSSDASIRSRSTIEPGLITVTLMHLNKEHYDYLSSIDDAQNANGNPFAQPSAIKSNISGGIGIFTGLSYDRRTITVTQ